MKQAILPLMAVVSLILYSCDKGAPTPTPPVSTARSFDYSWDGITLKGADGTDIITTNGVDTSNKYLGLFTHKGISFSIQIRSAFSTDVVQGAANGYNLTGSYDTVEIHKLDGSGADWNGTYGLYRWMGGRQYYLLAFTTSTTYFNKAYTDSL